MPDSIGLGGRIFTTLQRLFRKQPLPIRRVHTGRDRLTAKSGTQTIPDIYTFYTDQLTIGKTRIEVYDEMDNMDADDLPSSVLDTYAEDATQVDQTTGLSIWVENCSEEVRKIIEETFERIEIEDNIYMIARSLAKYGDVPAELFWQPGVGITAVRLHHPKRFKRFEEKETSELVGFYLGGSASDLVDQPNMTPWDLVHFRLRGHMSALYGTTCFWGVRRAYRRLRMAEDAAVIYRMQRHPDRDVFEMDVTDMTDEEAKDYQERFIVSLKKNRFYDPTSGQLRDDFNPYTAAEDIFFPKIRGREDKIQRLQGSNNANDVTDLEYHLARWHAGVRIPPGAFGYNIQGSTPYDAKSRLYHQDSRYARVPAKIQRYLLLGMQRLVQLDLAFRGLEPDNPHNKYTLCMSPVSYLDELHRQQLIELRVDVIDRLLGLGDKVQFNAERWVRYVLKEYAHLSDRLIDELLPPNVQPQTGLGGGPPLPPGGPETATIPPELPPVPTPVPGGAGGGTETPPPLPEVPAVGAAGETLKRDAQKLLDSIKRLQIREQQMAARLASSDGSSEHPLRDLGRIKTSHKGERPTWAGDPTKLLHEDGWLGEFNEEQTMDIARHVRHAEKKDSGDDA